ncbi:MAG: hypothetical protein HYZ15_09720 [Sphingobacteriales bacterium]|nr:hypothetical protein [Sphingobacteriales bacterium]
MQFEEFDKKIKEAADNHHPAYNEEAWGRMNKLLDKHLPRKEDRRRRFILLFLLLFILGGTGIVYTVQSVLDKQSAITDIPAAANESKRDTGILAPGSLETAGAETPVQRRTVNIPPVTNSREPATAKPGPLASVPVAGPERQGINPAGPSLLPSNYRKPVGMGSGNTREKMKKKQAVPDQDKQQPLTDPLAQASAAADGSAKQPLEPVSPVPASPVIVPSAAADGGEKKIDKAAEKVAITEKKADSAAMAVAGSQPAPQKKNTGKQKKNSLFISISAGPDASFTQSGKPGRTSLVTGAGIGYIIKERFSIRAGFYQATKLYSASPSAYNPPPNFYTYYPYLEKVDANCRVYEIPVSLGYHFGARKNHSWFASAGLSSYLMKRETYDYYYKTSALGATQQKEWTIRNRNQHFFTVLGFSGGYQRKITDRISFIAEPYLKLPLTGVGYGKVRLNSAGILFSVTVQPAALVPHKQKK